MSKKINFIKVLFEENEKLSLWMFSLVHIDEIWLELKMLKF